MARAGLTLVGEGFSPWTEKARWALDHHGVRYHYEEYVPLVDEPWLRLRARRLGGRISVPFLLGPGVALGDSFAIAREAERIGHGAALLPPHLLPLIETWNERSERLIAAGRAQVLARTDASAAAQRDTWARPALAARWEDVLAWRDLLIDRHRSGSSL